MIAADLEGLRQRAETLAQRLRRVAGVDVVATQATIGGGSLPGETLPSFGLAIAGRSADGLLGRLRRGDPSVVGRIEGGRVILDLRTVDPEHDADLVAAISRPARPTGRAGP
jgi:L-seryl-tRNA(Ser) seleniumtransferase